MSMPAPPPDPGVGGGGSFFTQKFMGIPAMVWLGGIVIVGYLYFRNRSSSGAASSSGGGGTSTTGNITLTPGATNINIPAANPGGGTTGPTGGRGGGKSLYVKSAPAGWITMVIPNGTLGWVGVAFPNQAAQDQYYSIIGAHYANGYWYFPNNFTKSQLFTALRQAGGVLISGTNTGTNTTMPQNPPETPASSQPGQPSQSGTPNPQVQPTVIPKTVSS